MRNAWWMLVVAAACGLTERDDFLIGRQCSRTAEQPCDPMQVCLPHEVSSSGQFDAFRCRDRASFLPLPDGREAPVAFCDSDQGVVCPVGLVCNADRVRLDVGIRRLVCTEVDNPLAPPLGDGGNG